MKILKTTSRTFEGNNLDYYDFDKLSSLEDVKKLLNSLEKINFSLSNVYVSEFGDYEDGPIKRTYTKEEIDDISKDFDGKMIELYKLIGKIDDYRMVATIYPEISRLELEYSPTKYEQLQEMISELDKQNSNKLTDSSNLIIK